MILSGKISKQKYLAALKNQMGSLLHIGKKRYTGFFLGSFFYITRHSAWEWNRRITNQKSAVLGFLKSTNDGCNAYFLRFSGGFCPPTFLFIFLFVEFSMLIMPPIAGNPWLNALVGIGLTFLIAGGLTFAEMLTEEGEDGREALLYMMMNPYYDDI